MGYAINPAAIFDFPNQTVYDDVFTFDKRTYQNGNRYDAKANAAYANAYRKEHPIVYSNTKSGTSTSSKSSKTYTVRKGDSLSRIASRNGTTVKALCRLNGLTTSSKLQPGQKLRLR